MIKKFKYSPPIKYLLQIPLGLIGAFMFGAFAVTGANEAWWFKLLMVFFGILFLAVSVAFFLICFKGRDGNKLIINNNKLILPYTFKKRNIIIDIPSITKVEKHFAFGGEGIFIIENNEECGHSIDKRWMDKKEYHKFFMILNSRVKSVSK